MIQTVGFGNVKPVLADMNGDGRLDVVLPALPGDWRERVKIGSDRKQSGTARENLRDVKITIPDVLSDAQKELCDYAAPGLRKLLGYE